MKAARLLPADNLVPFRNGLLRLDDGAFLPHSPAYFVTYVLQCDYSPYSVCPIFDRFLHEITGGDAVLTERIWEFIGVCLTREDIKKIFVLQGRANSGKSVLINTVNSLIPAHARSAQDVQGLDKTFAMKEYKDKLFCVSSDMSAKPLSSDVIGNLKKLSGRDLLNSDVKYGNHVEFKFTGHIAMVTNHPLMLKISDYAFWTRLVAIPFFIEIPEENRDPGLEKKLLAELPGIAFFNLRRKNYRFAGEYPVNSPQLFSDSVPVADTATLVFLFLQKYFERGTEDDLVVVEEAAGLFNRAYGLEMGSIQFSSVFCQHAAQMYSAEKVRSRAGGYKNARSCLKGLRYINN